MSRLPLRQRIVLRIRFWFRLPIDEIREQTLQESLNILREFDDKALETIKTLTSMVGQLHAKLEFYEKNIPRMRDLRQKHEREQQRLSQTSSDGDTKQRLSHGIVGSIQS